MKELQASFEKAQAGHNQNMARIKAQYDTAKRNWVQLTIAQQRRAEGVPVNGTVQERIAQERQWLEEAANLRQAAENAELAEQQRYKEEMEVLRKEIEAHEKEVCEKKSADARAYADAVGGLKSQVKSNALASFLRIEEVEKQHAGTEVLAERVARNEPVQAWQKPQPKSIPEPQAAITVEQLIAWNQTNAFDERLMTRRQAEKRAAELTAEMRQQEKQQREEIEIWNRYGLTLSDYRLVTHE